MVSSDIVQVATISSICFLCIATRTTYRIACQCTIHPRCHRTWHADDVWVAISFLPLVGRGVCIAWSNTLQGNLDELPASEKQAAVMLLSKLLLPGRIFYALLSVSPVTE